MPSLMVLLKYSSMLSTLSLLFLLCIWIKDSFTFDLTDADICDILESRGNPYHDDKGRFARGNGKMPENQIIVSGNKVSGTSKKYRARLVGTRDHVILADNQTIDGTVIMGKGTKRELNIRFVLESTYHLPADEWQKVSGAGKIIIDGKPVLAQLHWYSAQGKWCELKVKEWYDES